MEAETETQSREIDDAEYVWSQLVYTIQRTLRSCLVRCRVALGPARNLFVGSAIKEAPNCISRSRLKSLRCVASARQRFFS